MEWVNEQYQKFFAAERWYVNDTPRCEHRVIIGGRVARCEGTEGHHGDHPLVLTSKLAGAAEFVTLNVEENFLM
jgi:hypothetical protein